MKVAVVLFYTCSCYLAVHTKMVVGQNQIDHFPSSASVAQSWTLDYLRAYEKVVLSTNNGGCSFPPFYLGFYRDNDGNSIVLAISMGKMRTQDTPYLGPVIVWSENGDRPTDKMATLNLTAKEGLVLTDGNGDYIWSANTSGHSVKSMNLTCSGNLVLLSDNATIVWQSFDYPTDTWLPHQSLRFGQRLTSRASNSTLKTGKYYLSIGEHFGAFVEASPPIEYGQLLWSWADNFVISSVSHSKATFWDIGGMNSTYIRLDTDGHLQLYTYNGTVGSTAFEDLLGRAGSSPLNTCDYPTVCGNYGICFSDKSCDCPDDLDGNLNYFKLAEFSSPHLGCLPVTELSCTHHGRQSQTFLELPNVTYFGFEQFLVAVNDIASCKKACLEDCSCKAALYRYGGDNSSGNCSLPSQLLSLMYTDSDIRNDIAFIKVERPAAGSSLIPKLVPSISAGLLFIVLCAGAYYFVSARRRKTKAKDSECPPDVVVNTVARFSFDSLRLATQNFQNKLGRGGFGSVFEGTLEDGTKVAVKSLHSSGQTRKEFLAEVNIIGNLHHYNLVRLIGFCESGSNRLLVYEYMPNGSLDRWIFNQGRAPALPWRLRQSIINGIAKGLEYLHENCLQNVIHFDIKPQNILLDLDFTAKISDFGLAKMVDRDQSQVMTMIRGTPGYIAPELIGAQVISVKLDVYSFGVLVLEVICGRRNFGSSEGDVLTNLVKIKLEEDQLGDLIDERAEDMQRHKEEAVKMMKIGIWCLQPYVTRPIMSIVVKVIQDLPNMDATSDFSYLTMLHEAASGSGENNNHTFSTRPTESLLSGPR